MLILKYNNKHDDLQEFWDWQHVYKDISIFEENTSTQRSSEIHEVKVFDRTSYENIEFDYSKRAFAIDV